MKTKIKMLVATIVAPMALAMTACDFPTACEGLSASDKDKEAAANGYEVEREDGNGNTCELSRDGKTWETDD